MKFRSVLALVPLALGMGLAPANAHGDYTRTTTTDVTTDPVYDPSVYTPPVYRPRTFMSRLGVGLTVGGGITDFTHSETRDLTALGGSWTARLTLGTREFLGIEAAYVGSAQSIDAIGLDPAAVLVANGIEGALRVNLTRTTLQPYFFGGAAWKHYSLANKDFNDSNIRNDDDVLEIPVGVGLAWHADRLMIDGRFDYRPTFDDELIRPTDSLSLDNWNLTARVGFEF